MAIEQYLSPNDIADRLGVTVKYVRDEIRRGRLPAVRLSAGWRVAEPDLAEYLTTQQHPFESPNPHKKAG